jgi:hypothetical protein
MTSALLLAASITALLPGALLTAQDKAPERRVQGNVITSDRDPSLQIELPAQVRYVGADRWILYGVADCEVHVFVKADAQKVVQKMYWIQFEAYLPSKPDSRYNYNSPQTLKLAGLDFDVRVRVGETGDSPKAGSDLEHVRALIQSKGYQLPAGMISARLVHLLDEQKRKELMIIYGEDVKPTGFTATDLLPGGKGYEQWPKIEKDVLQNAERNLTLRKSPAQREN